MKKMPLMWLAGMLAQLALVLWFFGWGGRRPCNNDEGNEANSLSYVETFGRWERALAASEAKSVKISQLLREGHRIDRFNQLSNVAQRETAWFLLSSEISEENESGPFINDDGGGLCRRTSAFVGPAVDLVDLSEFELMHEEGAKLAARHGRLTEQIAPGLLLGGDDAVRAEVAPLRLVDAERLLMIPAGNGAYLERVKRVFSVPRLQVLGLDKSRSALFSAGRVCSRYCQFCPVHNYEDLLFLPNDYFDAFLGVGVLRELPALVDGVALDAQIARHVRHFLAHVGRVLVPGGRALLGCVHDQRTAFARASNVSVFVRRDWWRENAQPHQLLVKEVRDAVAVRAHGQCYDVVLQKRS